MFKHSFEVSEIPDVNSSFNTSANVVLKTEQLSIIALQHIILCCVIFKDESKQGDLSNVIAAQKNTVG